MQRLYHGYLCESRSDAVIMPFSLWEKVARSAG